MTNSDTDDHPGPSMGQTITSLKQAIWNRRPILEKIMRLHGQEKLSNFTKYFLSINSHPQLDARRSELVSVAKEIISQRLGKTIGDEVARQLEAYPLVSTTDHHGPIDHPFFVNSNIIMALSFLQKKINVLKHLVVFSFSSISLNNASAYARGILFHGGINGTNNLIRLPFFPDKEKMGVVYKSRPFNATDIQRAHLDLDKRMSQGNITPERCNHVHQIIDELIATPAIIATPDLLTQITKLNYELWPFMFHPTHEAVDANQGAIPNLVYLDIETLASTLLIRYHLHNSRSPIYRMLFDSKMRERAMELFDGIHGAHTRQNNLGTTFFWALNENNHRKQLELRDGRLFSENSDTGISISPEPINRALAEKRIFPNMILCYLIISLYYGMKCLGGFSQVNDLTQTKMAWQQLLREKGEITEAEAVEPVQTAAFGGDGLVLSYLSTPTGSIVPATGIDMILENIDTRLEEFQSLAHSITVEEMMYSMLPEMYTVLYAAQERDTTMQALTPELILKSTGLHAKLVKISQNHSASPFFLKRQSKVQPEPSMAT